MVCAILDGRKTQTRRVAKLNCSGRVELHHRQWHVNDVAATKACPHGQPSDALWVRETWATPRTYDCMRPRDCDPRTPLYYAADQSHGKLVQWSGDEDLGKLRPCIFLPRWASRITLEITGVRLERLNDITHDDARAEGIQLGDDSMLWEPMGVHSCISAMGAYANLWDAINGPDSWNANPWVWVIEFKRIKP